MKKIFKILFVLLIAVLISFSMLACGGFDDDNGGGSNPPSTEQGGGGQNGGGSQGGEEGGEEGGGTVTEELEIINDKDGNKTELGRVPV